MYHYIDNSIMTINNNNNIIMILIIMITIPNIQRLYGCLYSSLYISGIDVL